MAKNYWAGEPSTVTTGPSYAVWANCPWEDMLVDPSVGYCLWEDFILALEDTGGWLSGGTTDYCAMLATEVGGVVRVGATASDNDEGYLTSGNNEAGFVKIYTTTPKELWFEARVRPSSITDVGMFCGLAEEGLAAADTLANNTAALASKDFVGFHSDTAGPTALDCVYRKASKTGVVPKAAAQTMVAETWYKLGMYFDGTYLKYFVDGEEEQLTSTITGVDVNKGLKVVSATDFPDGEELAVLIGCHDGEGAAKYVDIDWVRVAQLR